MISYIIITVYLLGICWVYGKSRQLDSYGARKVFALMTFGVMLFLMAFRRNDVGNDTMAYIRFFHQMKSGDYGADHRIEIGFRMLTILIGKITKSDVIFMVCTVTIAFIPHMVLYIKENYRIDLAVIFFWLLLCVRICSVQRQGIAMAFVAVGYLCWRKDTKWSLIQYIFFCFVATLFHNSAIIMIMLPILNKKKIDIKLGSAIIIGAFLMTITNIIPTLYNMIAGNYFSRYSKIQSGWMSSIFNLMIGCMVYYLGYYVKGICNSSKEKNFMSWCAVLYASISIMAVNVGIMGRISLYFLPFVIVLLVEELSKNYKFKIVFEVGSIGALLGYNVLALLIRPEWNSFFPYYFFWQ